MYKDKGGISGVLTATIITPDPDGVILEGLETLQDWVKLENGMWQYAGERHNAFLNQGLQDIGRRWANITTVPAAPTGIAVSSDNTAVTAATTTFGGTFRYSAFNGSFPSISAQTVSFQSDFTKGSGAGQIDFSVRKIGVTRAATDTAGAVQDIIGGAGSSPYNEPLTIDLTSTTSFTFRPQIDVTFLAV